ncbi:restriction endonuclease subunit S [Flavobacterium sp. FlaQc-50]|jgi:type I restriction enzyme S subunit|uniref:restriction endonuclease subunit S n=1 Tax=unclassified Flavobacterium TaxID=196869 RepID=UPI0037573219
MENQLPKNWVEKELKEIIFYVIGGDWGKDPESINDNDYKEVLCIRGSEIKNWTVNKGNTASLRKIKKNSLENRKLKFGDILVEISGGGPDQPVGRTVFIDEEVLKFESETPKVCTNFLRLLRMHENLNSEFINHYLQYFYNSGEITKYQGGSNNLRNLKFKEYETILIPLPPLSEQNRIVAKLDNLFVQLETIKTSMVKIPVLLKNFRQQVLTQAVTGKLTESWRVGKELEEWKYEFAKDCCAKVQSGGTPKGSNFAMSGIPFLKVYNIVNNKIDFEYNPQYVSEEIQNSQIKKSITYPGDVIMNIVGPPLNKTAIIPNNYPEWNLNQAITLFRVKKYLSNKFLYYFFCEGRSVKSLVNETKGVVGQVNISLSQCRDFSIPIPSEKEQQEIVSRIESLFTKADAIEKQYETLKQKIDILPQAILHKAFKGELVKQLDSDGDAKDLLKEIEILKNNSIKSKNQKGSSYEN